MAEPTPVKALSRRTVLKGIVGTSSHARLTAGLAMLVAVALAGCAAPGGTTAPSDNGGTSTAPSDNGGTTTAPSDSGGTTTVTIMFPNAEFTQEYIDAFEENNHDIKIEFIEFDENRLNAMFTAGDPPDLVRGGPSANLFARGLAEPLDDYIANSALIKEDDLLSVNDMWRWDGEKRGDGPRYGLVKDFSPDTTLWQNSAVFEAAGVEPFSTTEPSSWDEVLEKAQELKAGGVEYPLGIEWQWGIAAPLQVMVEQQGGQVFSDDLKEANLNTPEALRAIQWLIKYGTSGVGVTSLNPLADGYDGPAYFGGRMAATMTGFWFGGNFANTPEAATAANTSTLVPTPTFDKRISAVLGGIGAYIPAQSDAKDEAWRVIEYFIGGQPGIDRATTGWGLPGLDSMWQYLPSDLPVHEQSVEAVKAENEFVIPLQDSPYITITQWNAILDREVLAAINGEKSAEEVAAAVTTEMNTLLAQGVDQLGG